MSRQAPCFDRPEIIVGDVEPADHHSRIRQFGVGQRHLLVIAEQVTAAPARVEAAEARALCRAAPGNSPSGICALPNPSIRTDTLTPRSSAFDSALDHLGAGLVGHVDIIKQAQRSLGPVDQRQQLDQQLGPVGNEQVGGCRRPSSVRALRSASIGLAPACPLRVLRRSPCASMWRHRAGVARCRFP